MSNPKPRWGSPWRLVDRPHHLGGDGTRVWQRLHFHGADRLIAIGPRLTARPNVKVIPRARRPRRSSITVTNGAPTSRADTFDVTWTLGSVTKYKAR